MKIKALCQNSKTVWQSKNSNLPNVSCEGKVQSISVLVQHKIQGHRLTWKTESICTRGHYMSVCQGALVSGDRVKDNDNHGSKVLVPSCIDWKMYHCSRFWRRTVNSCFFHCCRDDQKSIFSNISFLLRTLSAALYLGSRKWNQYCFSTRNSELLRSMVADYASVEMQLQHACTVAVLSLANHSDFGVTCAFCPLSLFMPGFWSSEHNSVRGYGERHLSCTDLRKCCEHQQFFLRRAALPAKTCCQIFVS